MRTPRGTGSKGRETDRIGMAEEGESRNSTITIVGSSSVLKDHAARWPLVRLGDVCEVITKGTTPTSIGFKFQEKGVNFLKIESFAADGSLVPEKVAHISSECHAAMMRSQLKAGDILFSIAGALGRVAIIKQKMLPANTNQALAIIRVKHDSGFDTEFLQMALQSPIIATQFKHMVKVTAQPNLSLSDIADFTLPLPPLSVQRAIVERLDSALARAGALEKRFAAIAQNAELSFKASLNEEFAGRTGGTGEASGTGDSSDSRSSSTSRNPSDPSKPWPLVRLGDVCEIDGKLVQDYAKYANYPHIGIDCIEKGTGALKGYRTVAEDKVKSGKYHFTPHHIIYSKIRPNLNKVATPEFEGLCSADSYAILPKSNCKRRWLAYFLRSENFLGYVVPISNTRAGMPKVNREELLAFEFPLPPLSVQRAIVSRLDAARKRADGIAALARQAAEAAANLRKALLKEAFE